MAFKRPQVAASVSGRAGDMKVVDELVLKSLAINPSLARGADPSSALEELRAEITTSGRSLRTAAKPAAPSLGDRRAQTVQLFLEQKTEDYQHVTDDFDARVAAVERERAVERDRTIDEIVGLITVILASGAGAQELEKTVVRFKPLLTQLEVSARDLVREAQRR
jgi:hypothetical protein